MKRNLNIFIAFAAGLLGGALSRWVVPAPVLAQSPVPSTSVATKDVRAQRFTLVTEDGTVMGTLGLEQGFVPGSRRHAAIKLFDGTGKEIWSAGGSPIRTLGGL